MRFVLIAHYPHCKSNSNHNMLWKEMVFVLGYSSANTAGETLMSGNQLPIISEQQVPRVAGANAIGQAPSKKGRSNKTMLISFSITTFFFLAVIAVLLAFIFKPFGIFQEPVTLVDPPSAFDVQTAYQATEVPYPSVSHMKYVNTKNLRMASIGQFTSSEVDYGKNHGNATPTAEGRAVAVYRNGSIEVEQSLAVKMSYDSKIGTWQATSPIEVSVNATPSDLPIVSEINEDFPNVLQAYNSKLAEMYKGAEITSTPNVTIDGGDINFVLTKKAEDGSTKTCDAQTTLNWDNGWKLTVATVSGDVATPEDDSQIAKEAAEEKASSAADNTPAPAPAPNTNNAPSGYTHTLGCYEGEWVAFPGVISVDGDGNMILKCSYRTLIRIDGRDFITDTFQIVGGGYGNGQRVEVIGRISSNGRLPQAPLVLNVE